MRELTDPQEIRDAILNEYSDIGKSLDGCRPSLAFAEGLTNEELYARLEALRAEQDAEQDAEWTAECEREHREAADRAWQARIRDHKPVSGAGWAFEPAS